MAIRGPRHRLAAVTVMMCSLCVACRPGQIPTRSHLPPQLIATADGLRLAASLGDVEGIETGLKAGLDINSRNKSGTTALMSAAEGQRAEVIRVLLSRGADPDAKDSDGHTAYWHAMRANLSGRVPFTRYHFDLFLPRLIRSDSAELLAGAMKRH